MKIAVTGASGLVGHEICHLLAQNQVETIGLVRNQSIFTNQNELPFKIQEVDFQNHQKLQSTLEKMDAVVHCAAKIGDWGPKDKYIEENTRLLKNILNSTSEKQKIIFLSSQGVYPFGDHHGTNEQEAISSQGIDGYTHSKIETEKICREYQTKGRNITILRPGFIYGKGDRYLIPNVVEALKNHRVVIFGSGHEVLNLTDVRLVSQACYKILSSPKSFHENNCYNIRDELEISKLEFFSIVAKQIGISFHPKLLPKTLGLFLARSMDFSGKCLNLKKAPPLTKAKFKFLGNNLSFSIEKIQQELDLKGGDFRSFKF